MSDGVQIYLTVLCTVYGLIGLGLFALMVIGFMTLVEKVIGLIDRLMKFVEWVQGLAREEATIEYRR